MAIVHICKGAIPFICLQWVGLILCIVFPKFVLYISKLIFGAKTVGF
jgi:TRAP-type mannitol/chloroaromatic compound transport system permease large subunit